MQHLVLGTELVPAESRRASRALRRRARAMRPRQSGPSARAPRRPRASAAPSSRARASGGCCAALLRSLVSSARAQRASRQVWPSSSDQHADQSPLLLREFGVGQQGDRVASSDVCGRLDRALRAKQCRVAANFELAPSSARARGSRTRQTRCRAQALRSSSRPGRRRARRRRLATTRLTRDQSRGPSALRSRGCAVSSRFVRSERGGAVGASCTLVRRRPRAGAAALALVESGSSVRRASFEDFERAVE